MLERLPFRFQQCFSPFNMLLFGGSYETELFRHLSNNVVRSQKVQKYIGCEELFKIKSKFEICKKKKRENVSGF